MKAPAKLWRCEPPATQPDLVDLTRVTRAYIALGGAHTRPETPLEAALRESAEAHPAIPGTQ